MPPGWPRAAASLQGGEEARPEVWRVRHQGDARGIGQRRHFEKLGDAADFGHAGLGVVDRPRREHVAKLEGGAVVLACRQRDPRLTSQPRQALEILGREDRLFEPVHVVGLSLAVMCRASSGVPRTVGVDHDLDIGTGGLARRPNLGFLGLVQFDVRVALLDASLVRAATRSGSLYFSKLA
jgi:hypothetical protein